MVTFSVSVSPVSLFFWRWPVNTTKKLVKNWRPTVTTSCGSLPYWNFSNTLIKTHHLKRDFFFPSSSLLFREKIWIFTTLYSNYFPVHCLSSQYVTVSNILQKCTGMTRIGWHVINDIKWRIFTLIFPLKVESCRKNTRNLHTFVSCSVVFVPKFRKQGSFKLQRM